MPSRRSLPLDERLAALRKGDPYHNWRSLDDQRLCILCERKLSGRQIEVAITAFGRVRLHCPTEGCPGTPQEWVTPGNPLLAREVWRDWERLLPGKKLARAKSAPHIQAAYSS